MEALEGVLKRGLKGGASRWASRVASRGTSRGRGATTTTTAMENTTINKRFREKKTMNFQIARNK